MRSERKLDHIRHALNHSEGPVHYFDEVDIVHRSLAKLDWEQLDISVQLGELNVSSPLFVNAMTGGGGEKTKEINRKLAEIAGEKNIAMAVGSQMAAIKDKEERKTYEVVREVNPDGIIFANVGSEATWEEAEVAIEMLRADALQIHLNTVQEVVMPEGDRDFSFRIENIRRVISESPVPVIVKEVGFGMSGETVKELQALGCRYVDVGGKGGTNFSKVENERRDNSMDSLHSWGIPTPVSILHSLEAEHIIASGGIRSGVDGAKALVLGAKAFGMAGPLLKTLMEDGEPALRGKIDLIHHELKSVMMILGCETVEQLKGKPYILHGETKNWISQKGV
ncbi:type 2 isopentenyl-diphosphate Delta-isomerase [Salimicrobium jeotgali]|uniref:Isopentenyl-diphosphate delta-isomerase n=1 Tax=Salimicrobium jeotgali TaxID=1230341 RepID=K2FP04_9BACI|nr:type 2 isopentenyl-diphosphate Delta-isomerase [Salimicrobium jeotgali]AKG04399.1 type 2 isopentenyl-diphosphate Delta-isomerase [Salimicrobium jeotgali]EKE32591.1 isopentenyl pyrophosphate isomerase [Salimicrobium jeotgali]MBM7695426.1 isopentenyl-diphosphate delta-isomerase [Salimicrobium jeotgali]